LNRLVGARSRCPSRRQQQYRALVAAATRGRPSHRPLIREDNGVLYLNPGSAGPRRFSLPVTLATVTFANGQTDARLVELDV